MAYGYDLYPPEYDFDPTCDCDDHPETHLHCPDCKSVIACPGDPETGDTSDLVGFTPNDEHPICPVCNAKAKIDVFENGDYLGDGETGIYTDWSVSDDGTIVYFQSGYDGPHHCDGDFFGADWCRIEEAADMAVRRLYEAADWCSEFGVKYSRADVRRFVKEANRQFKVRK